MKVVILGLSVTSSWGNGHATNYRALMRALVERGHDAVFLERDVPWYAAERDMPAPPWGRTFLYSSLEELRDGFAGEVGSADLVVVGSYVPDGVAVADWALRLAPGATAFFDIDTPVTLAKLERRDFEYLDPSLIPRFDLYLSFTGGPTLQLLEQRWGARSAHAFYCLVDGDVQPTPDEPRWDLGYLGTYCADRQPLVEELLAEPARTGRELRFVVAGAQYPRDLVWPPNVEQREHVPPSEHGAFYGAQRFTLNVTRAHMRRAGWCPSVRLFEAAAHGVPVISDRWAGIDELFVPGEQILLADSAADVLLFLRGLALEEAQAVGARARKRVLAEHTAAQRVEHLERLLEAVAA